MKVRVALAGILASVVKRCSGLYEAQSMTHGKTPPRRQAVGAQPMHSIASAQAFVAKADRAMRIINS